jgi:DNA-binding GntR family transcriptional regulator
MEFRSKSDVVAEEIRALIQSAELQPGEVLRQRDLARRFGVSPTPVREALRRLEAEGFITSELHRGARVVRTESARIAENFLIRSTLEGLATELAAEKITDEKIEQLEILNKELATCDPDEPKRFELNRKFHFGIYEAADSPILTALLNLLWRSLDEGPGHGRPLGEAVQQHAALLEALRTRDPKLASEVIRGHVQGGVQYETEHGLHAKSD